MKKSKKVIIFLIVFVVAILVATGFYLVSSGFIKISDNVADTETPIQQEVIVEEFEPDAINEIETTDKTLDYTSSQNVYSEALGEELDLVFPEFVPRVKPRSTDSSSSESDSISGDGSSNSNSPVSEDIELINTNLNEVERHAMTGTNKFSISYDVGNPQYSKFVAMDNGLYADVYMDSAEVNDIDTSQMLYCTLDEYSYIEPNVLSDESIQTYFTYKNNFGAGTMYIYGAKNNLSILSTFKYDNGHIIGMRGHSESYNIIMPYISDIIENGILFW